MPCVLRSTKKLCLKPRRKRTAKAKRAKLVELCSAKGASQFLAYEQHAVPNMKRSSVIQLPKISLAVPHSILETLDNSTTPHLEVEIASTNTHSVLLHQIPLVQKPPFGRRVSSSRLLNKVLQYWIDNHKEHMFTNFKYFGVAEDDASIDLETDDRSTQTITITVKSYNAAYCIFEGDITLL